MRERISAEMEAAADMALLALRDPPPEMLAAGAAVEWERADDLTGAVGEAIALAVWRAMVRAA